jgi:hypothetical protein
MKTHGLGCGGEKLLGSCIHVVSLFVVTATERAPVSRLHYRTKRYFDHIFAHNNDRKVLY